LHFVKKHGKRRGEDMLSTQAFSVLRAVAAGVGTPGVEEVMASPSAFELTSKTSDPRGSKVKIYLDRDEVREVYLDAVHEKCLREQGCNLVEVLEAERNAEDGFMLVWQDCGPGGIRPVVLAANKIHAILPACSEFQSPFLRKTG
jgi:hypothetical protein